MARLPLRYSIRNLMRRRTRTILTLLGLALVVSSLVFMLAFSRSLAATFRKTGDPDNIVIVSKKAQTFELSSIPEHECDLIRQKLFDDAVRFEREDAFGGKVEDALVSSEIYYGIDVRLENVKSFRKGRMRGLVHGVDPEVAFRVNSSVRLLGGHWPRSGQRELIVGSMAATRIGVADEALGVGAKLRFKNQEWTVVGHFAAPGTILESQFWTHVEDLSLYLRRQDYSFMTVKLADPSRMDEICAMLSTDEQFSVKAFPEQEYFADYAEGFDFFRHFAHALAVIIIGGGFLAGMNTMYTSVLGRVREIGTLQVIGFSKGSVLWGILTESVVLALSAGVLGVGLGYIGNGLPMKIPMAAFRVTVDLPVVGYALGVALLIGLLGAFIPAYRALRLRMVDAVRYQ